MTQKQTDRLKLSNVALKATNKTQSEKIKELKKYISDLNKEIGKRDYIINYQAQTNSLLVHYLEDVTKTESKIKNISVKLKKFFSEKIVLQ